MAHFPKTGKNVLMRAPRGTRTTLQPSMMAHYQDADYANMQEGITTPRINPAHVVPQENTLMGLGSNVFFVRKVIMPLASA